jgi:DNA replication protein DnaC
MKPNEIQRLAERLAQLRLPFIQESHQSLADEAAREQWTHQQYLAKLIEGESLRRQDRCVARRIAAARFPVLKTLDQFDWNWPKKINRAQVQHLFSLSFLKDHSSVVLVGGVGLGIMPGTGLCRAVGDVPLNAGPKRPSARHNQRVASDSSGDGDAV